MLSVRDILRWLDARAPFRYAMSWDRCGLQVGDPDAVVQGIMVALDPSAGTLDEALESGCRCMVTHHPLIFHPLTAVRMDEFPGNLVATALRKEINIIAVHTNLDAAREGTNDQLAGLLTLEIEGPIESDPSWEGEERYAGMGRVGLLPRPMRLEDLAGQLADALGGIKVRVVGDPDSKVLRVALCTGSGGSLIETVITRACDAYITGDVKFHEAQRALAAGLSLIDVGHFASERLVVQPLADYLRSEAAKEGFSSKVLVATGEKDPFRVYGK